MSRSFDVSALQCLWSANCHQSRQISFHAAKSLYVLLLLLGTIIQLGEAAKMSDISVQIERHFPCSSRTGPNKENVLIKFPGYKSNEVKFTPDKNDPDNKCFQMTGGVVEVYPPGLNGSLKYYVHLETRIGLKGKPERCVSADKNGCGGIGSCIHCDICKTMGDDLRRFVQIYQKGKQAKCSDDGLAPGHYRDLSLRICLPTKNELLPFLDRNSKRAEELWNLFVSSRARSGQIPLVITARLFDRPINKLTPEELNDALRRSKKGMIGCHWIHAAISQT